MDVRRKIKAGTLLESLIAMVLISIAFGLAVPVFVQVGGSTPNLITLKIQIELDNETIYISKEELRSNYNPNLAPVPGIQNLFENQQNKKFNNRELSSHSYVLKPPTND